MGRPDDTITTGITIAFVMVVAALSPHDAWRQPILRLVNTAVGVAVGVAAVWLGANLVRRTKLIGRDDALTRTQENMRKFGCTGAQSAQLPQRYDRQGVNQRAQTFRGKVFGSPSETRKLQPTG